MTLTSRPRTLSLVRTTCLLGTIGAQLVLGQQVPLPTVSPTGGEVGLRVVSPAGADVKTLSGAEVARSLTIDGVRVREGDDIKSLLRSHNIRPDAQALALTAQLNPRLSHLDNLDVGEHLLLPAVNRASPALKFADASTRIAITTAPLERAAIARSLSELNTQLDAAPAMNVALDVVTSLRSSAKALARPELIAGATPTAIHNLADNVAATVALVAGMKEGATAESDVKAIAFSAARLNTSVTTLSACRESGASCMAQLTVVPLDAGTRKAVADVRLYYAPVLWRSIKTCAPPNGHPCRHDFLTNAPAYQVGLSQDGSFAVWAARGNQVVSCDLQIDPPITSGSRTLEVYATAAEREAAGCATATVGVRMASPQRFSSNLDPH